MKKLQYIDRLKYNREILNELSKVVEKYPDLRFGQILINTDTIKGTTNNNGQFFVLDPFYEESEITLNRILESRIVSEN